jgi:dTMP kinase
MSYPLGDRPSWTELAVLFSAARVEHVHELILPSLKSGEIVVLDRYQCSTLAYQGATVGHKAVVESLAGIGPRPDVELLLDVDAEVGLQRRKSRPSEDCFEDSLALQQQVVHNYRMLSYSRPLVKVDGTCSEDEVTERIMAVLRWKGI